MSSNFAALECATDFVDQIAAKLARADGLNWDESCPYERGESAETEDCDSSTCIAAHYEDHDPDVARAAYRRYARTALTAVKTLGHGVSINLFRDTVHQANVAAGWWINLATGERLDRNVGEMLCLVHSEISEAMEGHRKSLMDDKLPDRPMIEVELADAMIRIADIAGGLGLDLGGAIVAKMAFNAQREDHKIEARQKAGGKAY